MKVAGMVVNPKNTNMNVNKAGRTEIEQARFISKTLGNYVAGRFLAKRGWSMESARYILLGI